MIKTKSVQTTWCQMAQLQMPSTTLDLNLWLILLCGIISCVGNTENASSSFTKFLRGNNIIWIPQIEELLCPGKDNVNFQKAVANTTTNRGIVTVWHSVFCSCIRSPKLRLCILIKLVSCRWSTVTSSVPFLASNGNRESLLQSWLWISFEIAHRHRQILAMITFIHDQSPTAAPVTWKQEMSAIILCTTVLNVVEQISTPSLVPTGM